MYQRRTCLLKISVPAVLQTISCSFYIKQRFREKCWNNCRRGMKTCLNASIYPEMTKLCIKSIAY